MSFKVASSFKRFKPFLILKVECVSKLFRDHNFLLFCIYNFGFQKVERINAVLKLFLKSDQIK